MFVCTKATSIRLQKVLAVCAGRGAVMASSSRSRSCWMSKRADSAADDTEFQCLLLSWPSSTRTCRTPSRVRTRCRRMTAACSRLCCACRRRAHLHCGDLWQSEYAAMHAAMLRGDVESRFLMAQGENGLADALRDL